MTNQATPRKNTKLIIIGLAVLIGVGLFVAKLVVESKIKAWATEDLSLYEPLLKLESAKVEASWLGSSVTYKNVAYTLPDVPGVAILIGEMTQSGIDGDTLMGKPGESSSIDKISLRNLRVLLEGYEAPLLEIGYYEVNDTSFPYRDFRATLMENKGSDDVMGTLQTLFPLLRDSKMRSGASRMSDFKMNLNQLGAADLFVGLITSSGFRELSPEADGFDGAMDHAAYKDIRITGALPDGSELLATLEAIEISGFKFNYRAMFDAFAEFDEHSDPAAILMAVLPSLYNYSFDEISANNLSVNASGVLFTLEKINLGPRTLKEQGPNSISNAKVAVNGMNVFSLEAVGLDKLILSDTIVDFINNPAEYMQNQALVLEFLENPLAALQGTALENFHIKNLDVKGLVKLGNWRADVSFAESVMIASRLDALNITNIGLRQASMALSSADDALRDVIELLAINQSGLMLDSELELGLGLNPQSIVYDLVFGMTAQEQGALAFVLNGMTGEPTAYYETYGAPLFDNMDISVEDKGILNNIFQYMAMHGKAADADAARSALVAELDANIARAGEHEAELLRGIKTFILQGGILSVAFEPEVPTALRGGNFLNNIENLNVFVSNSK